MILTYHNHQYVNCSFDPTMHERSIQMMLTLHQTDFSISIIYHTGVTQLEKLVTLKKDHFSQVISKMNQALIKSFRLLICCAYFIHKLSKLSSWKVSITLPKILFKVTLMHLISYHGIAPPSEICIKNVSNFMFIRVHYTPLSNIKKFKNLLLIIPPLIFK